MGWGSNTAATASWSQQQGAMLTEVVYAIAAAQPMKMIYVSSAHQATNNAEIDSASSLFHDYVSLHFHQH